MDRRSRTDATCGLLAAVGGGGVGLLRAEPWTWSVASTAVVLVLGVAVGAATRGAARLVGFLVLGVAVGAVVAALGHGDLAQGGLLTAMGGVLAGAALRRTMARRHPG